MHGLIEEWTPIGDNVDVHEHAVIWMHRWLPVDCKTAKKATLDFYAGNYSYERRSRTCCGYLVM